MRYEPDKQVQMQWLHDPNNRLEQIDGVIHFYLDHHLNDKVIESLDRPSLITSLAVEMFIDGESEGYRANVIRYALKELHRTGWLDTDASPYVFS